jgi:hypothetical protein
MLRVEIKKRKVTLLQYQYRSSSSSSSIGVDRHRHLHSGGGGGGGARDVDSARATHRSTDARSRVTRGVMNVVVVVGADLMNVFLTTICKMISFSNRSAAVNVAIALDPHRCVGSRPRGAFRIVCSFCFCCILFLSNLILHEFYRLMIWRFSIATCSADGNAKQQKHKNKQRRRRRRQQQQQKKKTK